MPNDYIILFKGAFQYNVINYFIEELAESFVQLGLVSVVIDLTKPDSLHELQSYLNANTYKIKCLFSFNGIDYQILGR
ncbi:MAG TPA: hypothetical protein VEC37_14655 [Bacillota bacterium]|nr:hypothetical protein [Bacillota bacterium]